jgi:nucleotide-binding universal stress UspA family protein
MAQARMKILCATDLLPKSEAAIDRAGFLADEVKANLSMLHVVEPDNTEHTLEQALHSAMVKMKSRLRPPSWQGRVQPSVIVRAGNPARVIVENLEQEKVDLVVLGLHRRRGLRDTLKGTVASKIVSARKSAVLIVREAPRAGYRTVVIALDPSIPSAGALRAAERLAITPTTDVIVVCAYEAPYEGMLRQGGIDIDTVIAHGDAWKRQARRAVRDFLKSQSADSDRYELMMRESSPVPAILRTVRRVRPDLLVLGTRGYGRARRAVHGSVANQVVQQTMCDALIVPEGSEGPAARRRFGPSPERRVCARGSAFSS